MRRFMDRVSTLCLAATLTGLLTSTAAAERTLLVAEADQKVQSTFTLSFPPEFGGDTTAVIVDTHFQLEVAGDTGRARLLTYDQQIDPLILPGGFSTGDITVRVVPGSSIGTYDEASGIYQTAELYEISFTEDLSMFGLTSPVILPGESVGTISQGDNTIETNWDGEGQLENPFEPGSFISFTYLCQVNTVFSQVTPCPGDVDGSGTATFSDLVALLGAYGSSTGEPGFNPFADFDIDGTVGLSDLTEAMGALGTVCE